MKKKEYQPPSIRIGTFYFEGILALSDSTGAIGEDVPWAAKRTILYLDDDEEYDEYFYY